MSFRDIRNLVEMLRALGYPTLVSLESFRTPNFPLVADLLVWLTKRFDSDSGVDVPPDIATEAERVTLIRSTAQFMAIKANIKLNTKRLYQADGYVVKELLKITTLLYDALTVNLDMDDDRDLDEDGINARSFDVSGGDKVTELKLSRQLASEITATGATLFDLLGKEVDLKSARQRSLARQFEVSDVEAAIKKTIETIKSEIAETAQLIDNVSITEASLDTKIERRKIEIDRYEKRLQTLKKVRPAFLEEFTALETKLEQLFVQYSLRLRILNYLEDQFAEMEKAQYEKQLMMVTPRAETIPLDESDINNMFGDLEDDGPSEQRPGAINRQERPRAGTGGRSRADKGAAVKGSSGRNSKAYGGMQPPLSGSPSLDLSSDSESAEDDLLFIDKDEPELMQSDDDESLAFELSAVDRRAPSGRMTSSKVQSNSDDDF